MSKLISISIAVVVSVILVGSLLVPVIQDADDGQKYTYVNKGYKASEVMADVSYSWDATNGITLSDSTKIPSTTDNGTLVIVACDTGFVKTNYVGAIATFYGFSDSAYISGTNITAMDVSIDFETKTITLSNIVASTTIADQTLVYNSWCYVPSADGDKILYAPISLSNDFYIEDDSNILGFFYNGATWAMSLDNDNEVSKKGTFTYTLNLEEEPTDYNDLNKINDVKSPGGNYSITVSDNEYYSAFIVLDREATGITDTGESISPILWVIPLLVIVAILVFVVRGALKY